MEKIEFQKVNEVYTKIKCDTSLLYELIDDFAILVNGYKFMPAYKKGHWDGKIRYIQTNGLFYNGLLERVWKKCKEKGYSDFQFTNYNKESEYTDEQILDKLSEFKLPFEFYDYQIDAIKTALTKKKRILKSSVSSGKSLILYSLTRILANDSKKCLVIVPTVMLVNQLKSDFEDYSKNDSNYDVNEYVHKVFAGESKYSDKPITISTYQSISALKEGKDETHVREFMSQFDCVVVDECHKSSANEIKLMLESAVNAKYRIGLTGTIDDIKSSIETLEGLLGKVAEVLTMRELIDSGRATDVKIVSCILDYPEEIRKVMTKEIGKLYNAKNDNKKVNAAYKYELDSIMAMQSRNSIIAKMVSQLSGNTVILTRFIENHAKPLLEAIQAVADKKVILIDKDTKADVREEIRKQMGNENDFVLIASYQIMSTGVNMPSLKNIIFACPLSSKIPIIQSIGRVIRKHDSKDKSFVFDIVDDFGYNGSETYAMKHFKKRFDYYAEESLEVEIKQIVVK